MTDHQATYFERDRTGDFDRLLEPLRLLRDLRAPPQREKKEENIKPRTDRT